jgi:hypothetical protein
MVSEDLTGLDRQRDRWRVVRQPLHLSDVTDEIFALGGNGGRVKDASMCAEANVLLRRDIADLNAESTKETAYSIGRQIENGFGTAHQRFRMWKDNALGDFDRNRYSRH